jgi:hypothetical protein
MILNLLEKYRGESFGDNRTQIIWGPVLPQDITRQVNSEQILIQTEIHSRRTAMNEIGVKNPEYEFKRWLEERDTILRMNKELNAKTGKNGARERALPSQSEGVEE